jgi:hypothetical protein
MATPWEDTFKNRTPKGLTVFATKAVTDGSWGAVFTKALTEFNRLSSVHKLGITLTVSTSSPDDDKEGEGGAEVRFDVGSGTLTGRSLGTDFVENNFSPTSLHGFTQTFKRRFGTQPARMRRAFVFVPASPLIQVAVRQPNGDFRFFDRQAGDGVRLFIAVHELIHACGLSNDDHSPERDPDVMCGCPPHGCPQAAAGPADRPDLDKIRLRFEPRVTAPPLTLSGRTATLLQRIWN